MKIKNFYAFLPSFINNEGHEITYIKTIKKFANINNLNCNFLIPENNIFEFKNFFKKNLPQKKKIFIKYFVENYLALKKIFSKNQKNNLFYIDGYSFKFLYSFLLFFLFRKKNNNLIVYCRYDYIFLKKFLYNLFILLSEKKFNKVIVITDSIFIYSKIKKNFFFQNIYLMPVPLKYIKSFEKRKISYFPSIWCPGQHRSEKFGENLNNFLFFNRHNDFLLRISKNFNYDIGGKFQIIKTENNLNVSEYKKMFQKSDIVILPYDSNFYKNRTSGIFFESIIEEKIIFVSNKTWMSTELKKFKLHQLIIKDWSTFDITKRYLNLDKANIFKKISIMKKFYCNHHNADKFIKILSDISFN